MLRRNGSFTSESVSEGHPDKVCDKVSDAILDHYLERNPNTRMSCDAVATKDLLALVGELGNEPNSRREREDIEQVARSVLKDIGYHQEGFAWDKVRFKNHMHSQSSDISKGVDKASGELGAGDQGLVFGYSCAETDSYMPFAIHYAHKITRFMDNARRRGLVDWLLPDAKSQVTVEYKDGVPSGVSTVVLSTCHKDTVTLDDLRHWCENQLRTKIFPADMDLGKTVFKINPAGEFHLGGPVADSGLTGRKITVDTYGGSAPHGGGAFSGKDASKVDRSGAYFARYLAKNILATGICDRCLVQISYAIGESHPVDLTLEMERGGESLHKEAVSIEQSLLRKRKMDMSVRGIINTLGLCKPIFKNTTNYGHMGKEGMSWEKLDLVDEIKSIL